ncbi:hypothetical protein [Lactiplantibacillus plantarum]|uniref:hypothetical protein n=1 Tax=Lactiplantibacillus plantarum TaxID=1590 RepID=UPI0007E37831|nr:hypothetical protein [Lactiplantibacillus plantarum]ANJ12618.1 hypothetical protein A8704_00700 [Lactiplantibacillus plantarum]
MVNTILKEADLFCPNSVRINFTIYHIIIDNVVKPHIDKFYALIIAEIALGFALSVYVMILAVLGGNMLFSQLSSLFS